MQRGGVAVFIPGLAASRTRGLAMTQPVSLRHCKTYSVKAIPAWSWRAARTPGKTAIGARMGCSGNRRHCRGPCPGTVSLPGP
jgi:hypothetical protein